MFRSKVWPRVAGAAALAALLVVSVSDVLLTRFWDDNAMFTDVTSNLLVLVVGVVVVNEIVAARAAREWRLVAHYALVEMLRASEATWVRLADALEVDRGAKLPLDDLYALLRSPEGRGRLHERCGAVAVDDAARAGVATLVADLERSCRDVLTAWAPVMVGDRRSARAVSSFANLHGRLSRLAMVLAENIAGHRLRSQFEVGDRTWIAARVEAIVVIALDLDDELRQRARELVPIEHWRDPGATARA